MKTIVIRLLSYLLVFFLGAVFLLFLNVLQYNTSHLKSHIFLIKDIRLLSQTAAYYLQAAGLKTPPPPYLLPQKGQLSLVINRDMKEIQDFLAHELTISLQDSTLAARDNKLFKQPEKILSTTLSNSGEYQVEIDKTLNLPRILSLTNSGTKQADNPYFCVNGRKCWRSKESLLKEIFNGRETAEEKALALYDFIRQNNVHFNPPDEGLTLPLIHDPLIALHIFGYGFCDDAASRFALLGREAGLQTRIYCLGGMGGHTVAEVYYNDSWHMFDCDHEIIVRDDSGHILSVEAISANPKVLALYCVDNPATYKKLSFCYASTSDNFDCSERYFSVASFSHSMDYILRPQESLNFLYGKKGRWWTRSIHGEPPVHTVVQDIFRPLADKPSLQCCTYKGEVVSREDELWLKAEDGSSGFLQWEMKLPWIFVDGVIRFQAEGENTATIKLYISRDGENWHPVEFEGNEADVEIDLVQYITNGAKAPDFHLWFKLSLPSGVALGRVQSIIEAQVSPFSLPQWKAGANSISYRSDTPESSIKLELLGD